MAEERQVGKRGRESSAQVHGRGRQCGPSLGQQNGRMTKPGSRPIRAEPLAVCVLCYAVRLFWGMRRSARARDLPLSLDVYFVAVAFNALAAGVPAVVALVDADVLFAAAGGSVAVLFVDADFFFEAVLLTAGRDRGGFGGGVATFVTFPSDARSLFREVNFTLYLDLRILCCSSVTPIRGREDTEGDRDAGFKVQIDWSRAFLLAALPNRNSKGRQERTSWLLRGNVRKISHGRVVKKVRMGLPASRSYELARAPKRKGVQLAAGAGGGSE